MLLNDIGKAAPSTLKKINQHLESNYGFKITEDAQDHDLVAIMETIQEEIADLKMKGDDAKASPEISKRLLILEGLKTLREYAIIQFQSPKLESVIKHLADYVVNAFNLGGTHMGHFNRALENAMEEYRSSKYRFPDDYVERRVKEAAMKECSMSPAMEADVPGVMSANQPMEDSVENMPLIDNDEFSSERNSLQKALEEDEVEETQGGEERAQEYAQNFTSSSKPADPFAAHAAARKQGIVHGPAVKGSTVSKVKEGQTMKEHKNLVKNLRRLLETEVSQAEVMMAAKGFAQELQEMVEKIGRLQNEDLPPVTDQMRETYGMESAAAFQTQIYGALQGVMDALYTAKNQVDDAVSNMAETGQVGAAVDMDKDLAGMDAGMGDMDAAAGADAAADELDLDNIGDELDDEFGGAEGEEQLGREMKESKEAKLKKKIAEMQRIVAKARKLKEARK